MADDSDSTLFTVPPGSDVGTNLPPVDLPTTDEPPSRPRITVTPRQVQQPPPPQPPAPPPGEGDDWIKEFKAPPPGATPPPSDDDDWIKEFKAPPAPQPPAPQVGGWEASGRGALDALTFGSAPALAGIAQAGGEGTHPVAYDIYKAITNAVSSHPDPNVTAAYERGRRDFQTGQDAAQEQHPWAYLGGQLAGAVLPAIAGGGLTAATRAIGLPTIPAMANAPGALARIGQSVGQGTLGGAGYGAGSALGQGQSATDALKGAAAGALTGAAFGGIGGGLAEGLGYLGSRVAGIFRGAVDPEKEAARRVSDALTSDRATTGSFGIDPEAAAAANAAGTPRAIVDLGGERTRALARSAANMSPEARQALTDLTSNRFEQQSPRVAGFIRDITGGPQAGADQDTLEAMARRANKPAYAAAYAAGDRPIWSEGLEQLTGAPAVGDAIRGAVERGKNRAVAEGHGAFRPYVNVTPDGRIEFPKGPRGVPTYPNLQFWDYTQRELRDQANVAKRAGRNEEATALKGLHKQLLHELDEQVPEFADARLRAAAFFKAEDASEAGGNFAKGMNSAQEIHEARKSLAKMSPAEKELFARAYANELANKVEGVRNRSGVINHMFIDSARAKQKIQMALGPDRARQLEALLRAEAIIDRARTALGNSTTARQLKELGMTGAHGAAGAGALAGLEYLHEHDVHGGHLAGAAIAGMLLRHGAHRIDERVARRVGEMLASNDPAVLRNGVQQAARTPWIFNGLRYATGAGARVAAHDIGPARSLAALSVGRSLLESEEPEEHEGNYAKGGRVGKRPLNRAERVRNILDKHGVK